MNIWMAIQGKQPCLHDAVELQGFISGLYIAENRSETMRYSKDLASELLKRCIERDGDKLGFIIAGVSVSIWIAKL